MGINPYIAKFDHVRHSGAAIVSSVCP